MTEKEDTIERIERVLQLTHKKSLTITIPRLTAERAVSMLKEQKHSGTWEWITEDEYRCSECKNVTCVDECMNEPQYLYCPYCGCKMTFEGIWVK